MKKTKHFIAIFLLFGIYTTVHSQNVFPTSDAIWNIVINQREHLYRLSGDTIIGGKSYNKLYLLEDVMSGRLEEYIGGFRQEGKKVWFRPSCPPFWLLYEYLSHPEESIVYDFSKNVGDTIYHDFAPGFFYWSMKDSITASIITAIDIDEQNRKIYHTSHHTYHNGSFSRWIRKDRWMEGIGSIQHGLFWFLSGVSSSFEGGPYFDLICFKQGNEVKYMNSPCNRCFCVVSDPDVGIPDKTGIPLEVVQENNSIRIQGESSFFPCELKLFSSIGQCLLEKKVLSENEEISIYPLKGIYLYQIQRNGESVKTGKIMIK